MQMYSWSAMVFKFPKLKKISETQETLVDVMSCHQDDVVKKLACLTKVWTHTSQTGATHYKARGFEREQCMFVDERETAPSYGLQFFSTCNVHYCNSNVKFWKILGVI